jgi:outer membrane protein
MIGIRSAAGVAGCALICLLVPSAKADAIDAMQAVLSNAETSPLPPGWTAGGAAYTGPSNYSAGETTKALFPGAIYLGSELMYLGDRAYYTFARQGPWSFYGRLRVRLGNLDPEDSVEWTGMTERKWQLEAGLGAILVSPVGLWTARFSSDISGRSKGSEVLFNWSAPLPLSDRWLLVPGAGVFWRSSKLANYYFGGVSPGEAAPGRPAYDVGSTWSFAPALVSTYRLSQEWFAGAVLSYERFPDAVRDSPLVDRKSRYDVVLGLGYVFR